MMICDKCGDEVSPSRFCKRCFRIAKHPDWDYLRWASSSEAMVPVSSYDLFTGDIEWFDLPCQEVVYDAYKGEMYKGVLSGHVVRRIDFDNTIVSEEFRPLATAQ